MITLAVETSGRAGSIALQVDGELRAERELSANGRRHARTLVPEIRDLLREHSILPRQLGLIAVSIGPGSFTGLRVGLVCAKTLAYAVGCPIIGVDTFLAVAAAQKLAERIRVFEDALRGDICAGEYELIDGRWQRTSEPRLVSFESWRAQLPAETALTGPGLDQWSDQLADFLLADATERHPQARWIAELGEAALRAGEQHDPWSLAPFYMRRSAAEEKADAVGATVPDPV